MVKENLQRLAMQATICSLSLLSSEVDAAPTQISPSYFDDGEFLRPLSSTVIYQECLRGQLRGLTQKLVWDDIGMRATTDAGDKTLQISSTRLSGISSIFIGSDVVGHALSAEVGRQGVPQSSYITRETSSMHVEATLFQQQIAEFDWKPDVSYQPDEIIFEWAAGNRRAIASLEGDGYLSYTMLIDGRFMAGADNAAKSSSLPADLRAYLTA